MRLLRSIRRPRITASATSPPAASNNAPPMANATMRAGLEFSGGTTTAFVGGAGAGVVVETGFGGDGMELVSGTGMTGGAGASFV